MREERALYALTATTVAAFVGALVAPTLMQPSHAQTREQIEWLDSLSAPVSPTAQSCDMLAAAFTKQQHGIDADHDSCLARAPDSPGYHGTCTKADCQNLHNLRELLEQRAQQQNALCRQRVAYINQQNNAAQAAAEQRKEQDLQRQRDQEAQLRAAQDQYQRQMQAANVPQIRAPIQRGDPLPSGYRPSAQDLANLSRAQSEYASKCSGNASMTGPTGTSLYDACQALKAWIDERSPLFEASKQTNGWRPSDTHGRPSMSEARRPSEPLYSPQGYYDHRDALEKLVEAVGQAAKDVWQQNMLPQQGEGLEGMLLYCDSHKNGNSACDMTEAPNHFSPEVEQQVLRSQQINRAAETGKSECAVLDNTTAAMDLAVHHHEDYLTLFDRCKGQSH